MPIYKRKDTGDIWHIDFRRPDGVRVRQSSKTTNRKDAQELHDTLKAQAWREQKLDETPVEPATRYLWKQAVVRWCNENSHKKSLSDDLMHFRFLDKHIGNFYLDDLTKNVIEDIINEKKKTGVKNSSVNRMLALLKAILNRAVNEWEWLNRAPYIRLLKTDSKRIRYLTPEQAQGLALELPEHLRSMFWFSLATGLRETNVTQLEWSQVDMQRRCAWIHGDQAKAGKPIAVPLNDDALAVLRAQIGKHKVFVFTYEGKPVTRANNHAWRKALKRAGIDDFRWHDLRHTWASWHVQNGTPLHALQELGGWSTSEMVRRYAHLSSEHLAGYANNVARAKTKDSHVLVTLEMKQA